MLQVTEKVMSLLRAIRAEHPEEAAEETYRLVRNGNRLELALDTRKDDDQIFTTEGENVLLVSPDVAQELAHVTIDVEETPEGRHRLTLSVPGG